MFFIVFIYYNNGIIGCCYKQPALLFKITLGGSQKRSRRTIIPSIPPYPLEYHLQQATLEIIGRQKVLLEDQGRSHMDHLLNTKYINCDLKDLHLRPKGNQIFECHQYSRAWLRALFSLFVLRWWEDQSKRSYKTEQTSIGLKFTDNRSISS